jgi:two-component system response regulator DesR
MRASARLGQVLATIGFADIARALFLSEGTVRNHLSAAIQKVGARNRGEAARIAGQKGWL